MAQNTSIERYRFDMSRFAQRIMKRPLILAFRVFKQTLKEMSHGARKHYFYQMVQEYKRLLQTHYRNDKQIGPAIVLKEIGETFVDFLRIAGFHEPRVVYLVRELKEALRGVDSDFFLELVPRNRQAELILSCVSGENWWDIRGSDLLMKDMASYKKRSFLLLKYGFPYTSEIGRKYWDLRCKEIFWRCLEKGRLLREGIYHKMKCAQRTVRLQLAMDTLNAVFDNDNVTNRAILSLLWKTVPHPFISFTEMFQLMSPFFTGYPQDLRRLCELYVKCNTVFDVPEVTSPRSLQHLSRVQLRRNLLNSNSLRDGVIDSLDIPRTIKAYLKLE